MGGEFGGEWITCICIAESLVAQMVKNPPAMQETPVQFLDWEDPWRAWQTTLVFLPGESHGQRRLADYRSWHPRVRHD